MRGRRDVEKERRGMGMRGGLGRCERMSGGMNEWGWRARRAMKGHVREK